MNTFLLQNVQHGEETGAVLLSPDQGEPGQGGRQQPGEGEHQVEHCLSRQHFIIRPQRPSRNSAGVQK